MHGWNSTRVEGICAGVPMITWPLFAEQFFNEKLIVQVHLQIGVRVGGEVVMHWGNEEKFGVLVNRENVEEAIEKIMGEGKDVEERREVKTFAEMAKKAMEEGGSSYFNISLLLDDIMKRNGKKGDQILNHK